MANLKLNLLMIFVIFFIGCDPVYHCYVKNKTNKPLFVKTVPPVESLFGKPDKDSIILKKQDVSKFGFMYKVEAGESFMINNDIGFRPTVEKFPYSSIEIFSENDTIILDHKEEIVNAFKSNKNNRVYSLILPTSD